MAYQPLWVISCQSHPWCIGTTTPGQSGADINCNEGVLWSSLASYSGGALGGGSYPSARYTVSESTWNFLKNFITKAAFKEKINLFHLSSA